MAFEREYFENLLHAAGGNVTKAARMAGVARTEVYLRIERFDIDTRDIKANMPPRERKRKRAAPPPTPGFPVPAQFAERAIHAKYATNAEYAGYAEYAEFANFADKEAIKSQFVEFAIENIEGESCEEEYLE